MSTIPDILADKPVVGGARVWDTAIFLWQLALLLEAGLTLDAVLRTPSILPAVWVVVFVVWCCCCAIASAGHV